MVGVYATEMRTLHGNRNQICLRALLAAIAIVAIGLAWAKNVGWRLDYQIATPALGARALRTAVYKDQRFSDHAPLIVDYDHPF